MTRTVADSATRPGTRPSSPAGNGRAAARTRGRRRRVNAGLAFVAPYLVFLAVFGIIPIGYGVYQSFMVTDPYAGDSLGTDNWSRTLSDYRLPPAVQHVGVYLALWLPLLLLVVVTLSLLVHARKGRFGAAMRFVYYLPGAVTGSAAVLMWIFMISPVYSPLAGLLHTFGLQTNHDVLSGGTLYLALTAMAVEAGAGGWIVILYGALQSIPDEVMEAAALDGATAWQQAVHIKLPAVRKYLAFIAITSFAGGTQMFVEPQMLWQVDNSLGTTWSPNQLAYTYASGELSFGRASVLSLLLLTVGMIAALVVIYKTKFYEIDAGK